MAIIGDLIKTTQSGGVAIDEYNGNISLMSAWINREGEVKPNFCKVEIKKVEKLMPIKIFLGSNSRAVEVLKDIISQIEGNNDDIPF